ncbi:helix-turn-helix transcriptional regulator [Streptomyces sp. TLI_171]|uniref:helix-turn-helix domain-containing protein n=1 Tax=Streptomyces sp. TLI_171 TaxID=1938859 RepID=UPI000C181A69|nr:helix-turn-helix transcriptional regulator [Streptomyces sp. TLI_171]RKE02891.1 helix-turn-helix protein [Streptomyces sp. TLI_171]
MGRRENAVAAGTRQSEALATWLRQQRERLGTPSYKAMAKDSNLHPTVLSRAASGRTVPSWPVVEAYATLCGADLSEARRLWSKARYEQERRRRHERTSLASPAFKDKVRALHEAEAVHPQVIVDFDALCQAMIEARARAGQPSLAELQQRAGRTPDGRANRLPASSLSAILRRRLPPRRDHVTAFTQALHLKPAAVADWEAAWDRAMDRTRRAGRRAAARTRSAPPPPPDTPPTSDPAPPTAPTNPPAPDRADPLLFLAAAHPATLDLLPTPELRREDMEFIRSHTIARPSARYDVLRGLLGPETAHPPAGRTRAGLPIRVPKRYQRTAPVNPYYLPGDAGTSGWFNTAIARVRDIVGLEPSPATTSPAAARAVLLGRH